MESLDWRWTWTDLMATPQPVIDLMLRGAEAEALAKKHMGEQGR